MNIDDISITADQFTEATVHYADVLFPMMAKTFNDLPIEGPVNVLDIGCGDGSLAEHLRQNCPQIQKLSLIDYDEAVIDAAYGRAKAADMTKHVEAFTFDILKDQDTLSLLAKPETVSFFSNISGYFTWEENAQVLSTLQSQYVIGNFFVYNEEAHASNLESPLLECVRHVDYVQSGRHTVEYVWDMGWRDSEGEAEFFTLQTMSEIEFSKMVAECLRNGYRVVALKDYVDFKQERLLVLERV